mmetsp:Transcript_22227/g.52531  ORF Transcript_22227/g.52531 Transcript_22227/m.52531 type:complete len:266 (-) Transcript_22227:34-831(-)
MRAGPEEGCLGAQGLKREEAKAMAAPRRGLRAWSTLRHASTEALLTLKTTSSQRPLAAPVRRLPTSEASPDRHALWVRARVWRRPPTARSTRSPLSASTCLAGVAAKRRPILSPHPCPREPVPPQPHVTRRPSSVTAIECSAPEAMLLTRTGGRAARAAGSRGGASEGRRAGARGRMRGVTTDCDLPIPSSVSPWSVASPCWPYSRWPHTSTWEAEERSTVWYSPHATAFTPPSPPLPSPPAPSSAGRAACGEEEGEEGRVRTAR